MSRQDSILGKQCQAGLDPTGYINSSALKATILLTTVCSLFLSLGLPHLRWSRKWIMALKNSLGVDSGTELRSVTIHEWFHVTSLHIFVCPIRGELVQQDLKRESGDEGVPDTGLRSWAQKACLALLPQKESVLPSISPQSLRAAWHCFSNTEADVSHWLSLGQMSVPQLQRLETFPFRL